MTVCAFLNQGSGQVLFGVTRAGIVVGQQVSERTIEELSAEFRQIDPPAFPTIERVSVDGDRDVIVVSTSQGASRPYTYRGSAYRRVGNTTLSRSSSSHAASRLSLTLGGARRLRFLSRIPIWASPPSR